MTQAMKHWSEAAPIEPGMLIEIIYKNNKTFVLVVNHYNQIISLQGSAYNNVRDLLERNPTTEAIRFRTVYGDWSHPYSTKKPEETYKVGQRIKIAGFVDEYIIARVGFKTVAYINLTDGNYFNESYTVRDSMKITKSEMLKMLNHNEFELIK